jgi:hypothetical protein
MRKCSDALTEEGRLFDEAMGGNVEDGPEGVKATPVVPVEGAREPSDAGSSGPRSNDAMPDDEPPHAISPQRSCDNRQILRVTAFFLVAFAGGAVVGLMAHANDAESFTAAEDANEPPTTGLLRSTRSPSPSQSPRPANEPADTSTSNIVNTQPSNNPAPTPLTIDVSSWIDAFNALPIGQDTVTTTTSTTTTTQGTTTTNSSINLDNWVDTFNAITMAGGAVPCLTDEACDAQRQSMGFADYEVGD